MTQHEIARVGESSSTDEEVHQVKWTGKRIAVISAIMLAAMAALAMLVSGTPASSPQLGATADDVVLASGKCSAKGENCKKTGCCSDPDRVCYEKDQWWSSCLKTCQVGLHSDEVKKIAAPWTCKCIAKRPTSKSTKALKPCQCSMTDCPSGSSCYWSASKEKAVCGCPSDSELEKLNEEEAECQSWLVY